MKVESLGSVGGACHVAGEGSVAVDRLGVVLVIRTVEFPPHRADQRRIEMVDRVERLDQRSGGTRRLRADPSLFP